MPRVRRSLTTTRPAIRAVGSWLLWVVLAALALQLFFVLRVALMVVVDPHSTAFMRSEAWRVARGSLNGDKAWRWSHRWVDADRISPHLKRAVIASEDAGFTTHGGVDWKAIEAA
jgi:monofunctional glycosyltransferase